MPYIDKSRRDAIDASVDEVVYDCLDWGDVNYAITTIVTKLLLRRGLSYAGINSALGCFSAAKAEFYDRVARLYEDKKIVENGDIRVYEEIEEIIYKRRGPGQEH